MVTKGNPKVGNAPVDTRSTLQSTKDLLLSQGKDLAKRGQRKQARSRFARVLAIEPNHVEALLWLAGLALDPRQSMRYLYRVLRVSPGNPTALAGMEWAQKRLKASPSPATLSQRTKGGTSSWFDVVLVCALALIVLGACAVLTLMAWQTPNAVRAAYQPTATWTSTWTAVPTHTLTPTATPTSTPTSSPTSTPTATYTSVPTATATQVAAPSSSRTTPLGTKWIDLDLSEQSLTAYEGETAVFSALVSTGLSYYPTPVGEYKIYRRVRVQAMGGPGYYLPNVEFVSYFYKGYAIHGAYWHNNFGQPMSHGCVNMRNADAKWIYNWAPLGTRVVVHQ